MEQLKNLTPEQELVIKKVTENEFLTENFYFTGGTALSAAYLEHRLSDDLDFFSFNNFDSLEINSIVNIWARELNIEFKARSVGEVYIFELMFSNGHTLKTDFVHYPYKQLMEPQKITQLKVDSLKDIASNKLVTIGQRTDVKDFVDLYFLLEEFGVFELLDWSNIKFKRDYDVLLLASDLTKIERFDYLPRMIKPLNLRELKNFYTDLAKKLGVETTTD